MSTTIDNKVVEMRFDNTHFERNVQTSLSTIEKLKQSLNFSSASTSLESVGAAVKGVDMSGLSGAVVTVSSKFSALQVMAITALSNITNSAVNAGKRMVSALTIDPVKTGFSEYETKINAIQTIMSNTASKGTTMQDVTRVIGELNTYADKTIYNFAEMTRNIGTFTAAGVGLEESAAAIQGIANLAAASGSTSQQASTAMYQLSQALSSGTVKLMDWNSVVNAGMGGEKFQEALKATAREHGIAVDAMIEKAGSFRESLQDGWITADVLNETLRKFTVEGAKEYAASMIEAGKWTQTQADALIKEAQAMEDAATKVKTFTQLWDTLKESAQSGWSQTWEIIVGDFEEAKETLTKFSDVIGGMIGASADSRNKFLEGGLRSGWDQFLGQGITDGEGFIEAIKSTAKEHGISVNKMIDDNTTFEDTLQSGWMTTDILAESITKYTDSIRNMSDSELESIGYTREQVNEMLKLEKAVKDGTISLDEFVKKMSRPSGRENLIESVWNVFNALLSIVKPIKEAFTDIFPPATSEQLYNFTVALREFTAKLTLSETASNNLKRTFKGLFAVLDIVGQLFSALFRVISPLFGKVDDLGGGILELTAKFGDWLVNLSETIRTTDIFYKSLSSIATFVKLVAKGVAALFKFLGEKIAIPGLEVLQGFFERITSRMTQVGEATEGMHNGVTNAFKAMGTALESCTFFRLLQSLWKVVKTVTSAVLSLLDKMTGGIADALGNANFDGIFDLINSLSLGGIAIFVAKFVKGFADITESVGSFKDSAINILDSVRGCFEAYQSSINAGTLLKIASAIAILVGSILVLSLIDSEKLTDAIGAITMLFAELMGSLAIFTKIAGPVKGVFSTCNAMISISIAVLIMASALKKVGELDSDQITNALTGLLGLTVLVIAASRLLGRGGIGMIGGAIAMIAFATAVRILAGALVKLSDADPKSLVGGLGVLAGMMLALAVAMRLMPKMVSAKLTMGLIGLAGAMLILSGVMHILSKLSWDQIQRGLAALAGSLLAVSIAMKLMPKNVSVRLALGLTALAGAVVILSGALYFMSKLSWEQIGRGLATLAGALLAVSVAMRLMPKMVSARLALGLVALAGAMVILTGVLHYMGNMSWEQIGKGLTTLAGSLLILSVAVNSMSMALGGAAAILVVTAALLMLTPVLLTLGNMSWGAIGKGLLTIAGVFVIFGVAGALLAPIVPIILVLSAAIALFGVGCLAAGAGLMVFSAGLASLVVSLASIAGGASAIISSIKDIILSVVDLIPAVARKLGEALLVFCEVIAQGAPAIKDALEAVIFALLDILVDCIPVIGDALKKLIPVLCDVLLECVPEIVKTLHTLIVNILQSLVEFTPQIVDSLFKFILAVLEGISRNIPSIIKASIDILMSIFVGVVEALEGVDMSVLLEGIKGVGLLSLIVIALAGIAALVPAAMLGVVGFGVVVAELGIVLAALGALAQIPGLKWLISEGGNFMQAVGTAIGQFVGGIVGGVAAGITSALPQIGTNLSGFMENVQPFLEGAKSIDPSMLDGVKSLIGVVLAITAAEVIEGIASFITGGNSVTKFAFELLALGKGLKAFATEVADIEVADILVAAQAAQALSQVADSIPNSGGILGLVVGENSMTQFGIELVALGKGLKKFSEEVDGVAPDKMVAAAEAAKALSEVAANIPNSGGIISLVMGDNSMSLFALELVALGKGLKGFSTEVADIIPENVTAAASAAKSLAEMASHIPNSGGILGLVLGENSMAQFGIELVALGKGLKSFATEVADITPENVTAAAEAAKILAEMSTHFPNSGGIIGLVLGDNSMAQFGIELAALGRGLKSFSTEVADIVPENVTAAAQAAQALSQVAANIPNSGGIISLVMGDNSMSLFALELVALGKGLKGFSTEVADIIPENVTAAASAAKSLAEMASYIPTSGGIISLVMGDNSMTQFALELVALGKGIKAFSLEVTGIVPENVTAAAQAAKSLAELTTYIPNSNGIVQWFSGEASLSKFGSELPELGKGLKGFSDKVEGITPENITAAANAAKSLAEMTAVIPKEGGIKAWFSGETSIANFAGKLPTLGEGLKGFSDKVEGISPANVTAAANAAKSLAQMADTVPSNTKNMTKFGENLIDFGEDLKDYFDKVKNIGDGTVSTSSKALKAVKDISTINSGNIKSVASAIKELTKAVKKMADDIKSDLKNAGKEAIEAYIKGIEGKLSSAKNACKDIVTKCADAIEGKASSFGSAGRQLVAGFCNGISENTYKAEAKARAMAKAAAKAAEEALDINSPSKVGYGIGNFFGLGFVNAIGDYASKSYRAASEMADSARSGLSDAIKKVGDFISGDMDTQPTIRPILDLSDVESGASAIGRLFKSDAAIEMTANANRISAMMNRNIQNGSNSEVVSAINKLRKDLGNVKGDTYSINGITYDDGSNITDAVRTIVRAAKIERRV